MNKAKAFHNYYYIYLLYQHSLSVLNWQDSNRAREVTVKGSIYYQKSVSDCN